MNMHANTTRAARQANDSDGERGGGRRRMFYTPTPNGLFFAGAFPDLTPEQILSLIRHFHCAMLRCPEGKRFVDFAFNVAYDAPARFIASHATTAARNNRVLVARGYIELVRQNRGKPPTFRLTPKLREKLLRTTTEIRADRDGRPRKRRIANALLKWQKETRPQTGCLDRKREHVGVQTGCLDRKRGRDLADNDGGNGRVETGCLGSGQTGCLGSGQHSVFDQKRDTPKRDYE